MTKVRFSKVAQDVHNYIIKHQRSTQGQIMDALGLRYEEFLTATGDLTRFGLIRRVWLEGEDEKYVGKEQ